MLFLLDFFCFLFVFPLTVLLFSDKMSIGQYEKSVFLWNFKQEETNETCIYR